MRGSFRVEIVAQAEADLRAIHHLIAQDKPQAADKWLSRILKAARSLRSMPFRCEVIPEAEDFGLERRHFILGNYRMIYRIDEKRVRVLRIIHAGRRVTRRMLDDEPTGTE
jgi:plasmid stabilization system protein ParE